MISHFFKKHNNSILFQKVKYTIERYLYCCQGAEWYQLDLSSPKEMKRQTLSIPVSINMDNRDETINWLRARKEPWLNNNEEIKIALEDGQDFVNVKLGEEIIAYSRIERKVAYVGYFEKKIDLPQRAAFIGHIYVDEKYRRKGIGEYLLEKIIDQLKSQDFQKLGLHIATWNLPMKNMIGEMRFRKIAYIRYVKILWKIRFWIIGDPESKRFQLSLGVPDIYHSNR